MRQIWSLALACLTTKHGRILISYKFFHIKAQAKQFTSATRIYKFKIENAIIK